jgi:hypothetical protein
MQGIDMFPYLLGGVSMSARQIEQATGYSRSSIVAAIQMAQPTTMGELKAAVVKHLERPKITKHHRNSLMWNNRAPSFNKNNNSSTA